MRRFCYLLIFILLIGSNAHADSPLDAILSRFASTPTLRHASVGICITDLYSHQIVGQYNAIQSQITASTLKTLTAATALQLLGTGFTFHTRVYVTGPIDHHGKLNGDIIIAGGGDPTLGSRHFHPNPDFVSALMQALSREGIRQVKGNLVIDDSLYSYPTINSKWMVEDLARADGTGAHAVNFADNVFTAVIGTADGELQLLDSSPEVNYITLHNHTRIIPDSEGESSISSFADSESNGIQLYGTLRSSDKPISIECANHQPALLLSDSIQHAFDHAGIKLKGKNTSDTTRREILDFQSPRLPEILKSLLYRSDNMYTEAVLRAIAVHQGKEGSSEQGVACVRQFWESKGLDISSLFNYDGCGLARNDKASAQFFCEMLTLAEQDSPSDTKFSTLLPTAGRSGSVRRLLADTQFAGKYALKSGSMSDVQCYVGYYPAQYPQYSIAILISNFNGTRASLLDRIESILCDIAPSLDR